MLIKEALDQWLQEHAIHLKDWASLRSTCARIKTIIGEAEFPPTTHDAALLFKGMKHADYWPGTIKSTFRVLRRVINWHVENEGLLTPTIQWPRMLKVRPKSRVLTIEERNKLGSALREYYPIGTPLGGYVQLFVHLVLETGLRLQEALNITYENIDVDSQTIEVWRPKTEEFSVIPLSYHFLELLTRQTFPNDSYPPRNLRNLKGAIFGCNHYTLTLHVRKLLDDCCNQPEDQVERRGRMTIHSLRDSFATMCVEKGMPLNVVSTLLGHTGVKQTLKYVHNVNKYTAENVAKKFLK